MASSARIEQVDLHRRQRQFLGNRGVFDGEGLIYRLALDPFAYQRRRGNRRAAAIGLELGIFDDASGIDLDLQFHHVAAGRRPDHAGADTVFAVSAVFVRSSYPTHD